MPLINFDSPVVQRNKNIKDESVVQIDVKEEDFDKEKFLREIQKKEEYLRKKEEELNRIEERIIRKNEKIKLVIQAMIKKDQELKKMEMQKWVNLKMECIFLEALFSEVKLIEGACQPPMIIYSKKVYYH